MDAALEGTVFSDDAKTTESGEGGAVAVWEDQSGNGNDWEQPTAGLRPVYQLSNGRIYSVGGGQTTALKYMIGQDISSWTEGVYAGRLEVPSGTGSRGAVFGVTSLNSSSTAEHFNYDGTSSLRVIFAGTSTPQGLGTDWGTAGIPAGNAKMSLVYTIDTDGVVTVTGDEAEIYSADRGNVGFRTAPYLGSSVRSGVAQWAATVYWYRFAAFSAELTAGELTSLHAWLEE
jgi:hypothetical protein